MATSSRIAGLDGLRAIAVSLTIWMHLAGSRAFSTSISPSFGRQGVCLFFVLSGYLITRSLQRKPGIASFYKRRVFSIFPSFYAYLTVVGILAVLGLYSISRSAFLAAATCWMNWYRGPRGWPLEHTWSLAVEEQFYLIWPLIYRFLKGWSTPFLIITLLGWPVQRFLRHGRAGHATSEDALFSVTYDSIIWGVLGALLSAPGTEATRRAFPTWALPFPLLALAALYAYPTGFAPVLIPPLRGLAMAYLIVWISTQPQHLCTRILEWAPLAWVGRRSYSLYLWHILFCDIRLTSRIPWPLCVLAAVAVGALAYRLIEQPSRRLAAKN